MENLMQRRKQRAGADKTKATSLWGAEGRTESSNARRFAERWRGNLRYCDDWGRWLIWDGSRWKADDELRIEGMAKEAAAELWTGVAEIASNADSRSLIDEVMRFARASNSALGIRNAISLARSETGIPISPSSLDTDSWLLNVVNGTLDLRTARLRPHSRDDQITKMASVVYNPDADCPGWRAFTDRIMGGNTKLVGFLRRCCGLSLTGVTTEHVLIVLYGNGANGKSTFLNTLCSILGDDYSMKAPADFLMIRKNDAHPTERADLFGKRLVTCIETEDGRRLAESLVKELTGGDPIRARWMRENFWQFLPTHKLWLAANHRPVVRGTDLGIWRRLKLVPFTVTIPRGEQDLNLAEKLKAESSGILNWCLEGLADWQAGGLQEPAEVMAATGDYKEDMDTVGRFLGERCVLSPNAEVTASALYAAYRSWSDDAGEHAVSQRRFGDQLTKRGIDSRHGTGNRIVRVGVGLLTEEHASAPTAEEWR